LGSSFQAFQRRLGRFQAQALGKGGLEACPRPGRGWWVSLEKWLASHGKKTSKTMDFPAGKECWSNVGLMLDDLGSVNMDIHHD
jgi:hypothetical protein